MAQEHIVYATEAKRLFEVLQNKPSLKSQVAAEMVEQLKRNICYAFKNAILYMGVTVVKSGHHEHELEDYLRENNFSVENGPYSFSVWIYRTA